MTKVEKLILENQEAIMWALSQVPGVSMGSSGLRGQISKTQKALGKKE